MIAAFVVLPMFIFHVIREKPFFDEMLAAD